MCLKLFGGYLGNVEKVLGFQYFCLLRTLEFTTRFKLTFVFYWFLHTKVLFGGTRVYPSYLEVRTPAVASAGWGATGLPKSLGSKIPFSRKRCWENHGPTQLSWK